MLIAGSRILSAKNPFISFTPISVLITGSLNELEAYGTPIRCLIWVLLIKHCLEGITKHKERQDIILQFF
jgi:hypothetical protein